MTTPILECKNLTKIYRKSHLGRTRTTMGVKNLSLTIHEGEIFGLLGLNGAGKTTTLKLILGLLFPTSGEIVMEGQKMPQPEILQHIGFLPEVPYFPKHLSVEEILKFYGTLSGLKDPFLNQRIEEVLIQVRMQANRSKRVGECSKGMLQRLSLAQALIHNPSFLILDEPVTGLDPLGLTEMREILLDLRKQKKTILFSSHMIAEVEKIAERVAILVNGEAVRTIDTAEWSSTNGKLETLFVETIQKYGGPGVD